MTSRGPLEGQEARRASPGAVLRRALAGTDDVVAVTGASGWLGSVALDLLFAAMGEDAPQRVAAYASTTRSLTVADGRRVVARPLEALLDAPAPTTILHLAFVTREKVADLGVDAYTATNLAISATVLDAVALHRPRAVVVSSSGAVHAAGGRLVADLRGDPYGTLKHVDELAFRSAARDVGAACVIPRVFNVAGPRMSKPSAFALGSMITMAAAGGPVVVQATRPVHRAYCGVDEVVALSLLTALRGRDEVFDTGGVEVELGELARVVAHEHGLGDDAVVRRLDPGASPSRYVGDGRRMAELAEGEGMELRTLPELVRQTSQWLVGTGAVAGP